MALQFMGRAPIGPIEKQVALTDKLEQAEEDVRGRILGEASEALLEEIVAGGSFWEDDSRERRIQFEEALRRRRS